MNTERYELILDHAVRTTFNQVNTRSVRNSSRRHLVCVRRTIMCEHGMSLDFEEWFLLNQVRTDRLLSCSIRRLTGRHLGSTPLASYRIVSIEPARSVGSYTAGNVSEKIESHSHSSFCSFQEIGEWEEWSYHVCTDDRRTLWWSRWSASVRSEGGSIWNEPSLRQILFNRFVPRSCAFRHPSSRSLLGRRVAIVRSVDGSPINCFTIHECEGPARLSSRPRRYIFTGHDNGSFASFAHSASLSHWNSA